MIERQVPQRIQGISCNGYWHPESGLIEFAFRRSNNAAVDELMQHYDRMLQLSDREYFSGVARILYDTRVSGALPLFYYSKKLNEWSKRHPNYKPSSFRVALLFSPQQRFYDRLYQQMLKLIPSINYLVGSFINDRDAAIRWLMSDETSP